MSLPREKRLRKSYQFTTVREKGISRGGRLLVLACLLPEAGAETTAPAKCGFTLSRKLGNAVARNLTRRRLREVCREAEPFLAPGSWVVTIPKRNGMGADQAALRSEWRYLARKLGLLPPKVKPTVEA